METGMGRSPTFVVGSERQRGTLDALVKREQHFAEHYQKNKPLCFNAKAFQKTHPQKLRKGQKDADATLCSPMLVAVADGVSQIEEFGIDASELPNELLNHVEELAVAQLLPGQETEEYLGPISLVREAYENTESLGSTTVLTAIMDNSTKIHGKLHPMIAVCSIGDCEILILRRGPDGRLQAIFHSEMQRIDGNVQSPLQLARVDDQVDPDFDPSIAIEVIERGSAVHCISAFEGDIVVLGSDGVFDNLFIDEILSICEEMLNSGKGASFRQTNRSLLGDVARRIITEAHSKTFPGAGGNYRETPIGRGGKIDDTSVIVGEVVEWTDEHGEAWSALRRGRWWKNLMTCGGSLQTCDADDQEYTVDDRDLDYTTGTRTRNYPSNPNASFTSNYGDSFTEYGASFRNANSFVNRGERGMMPAQRARSMRPDYDDDDDRGCTVM